MRRQLWILSLCSCLAGLLFHDIALAGGKGKGRGGKGNKSQVIVVTPETVFSPIRPENPLKICVSGFSEGNFVGIQVPMAGDPQLYSTVSYSQYIDATGGFCYNSPPAWTNLTLAPGVYRIYAIWAADGYSSRFREGPETWITVVDP